MLLVPLLVKSVVLCHSTIPFLTRSISQIYTFKPIVVSVSSTFLLLLIYTLGIAWANFLPRRSWVERYSRLRWLGPIIEFVNPGDFGLKEVRICYLMIHNDSTLFLSLLLSACSCNANGIDGIRWKCSSFKFCCPKSKR